MNLFVSWMRTIVPILVGAVVAGADLLSIDTDSSAVTAVVTTVAAAVYYSLFRVLEDWADRTDHKTVRLVLGVLIGWAKPPHYEEGSDTEDGEGRGAAL